MPAYIAEIETRVCGIPCKIGVKSFEQQAPWSGSAHNCPSSDDFYGWYSTDYDILDRRGNRAEWLERKMSKQDHEEVEQKILDEMGA